MKLNEYIKKELHYLWYFLIFSWLFIFASLLLLTHTSKNLFSSHFLLSQFFSSSSSSSSSFYPVLHHSHFFLLLSLPFFVSLISAVCFNMGICFIIIHENCCFLLHCDYSFSANSFSLQILIDVFPKFTRIFSIFFSRI